MKHTLHPDINLKNPFKVILVGAGGTGSKVLTHLKSIHLALKAMGYAGLSISMVDPDTVSETNLIRQNFYPSDVGKHKVQVLAERLKFGYGITAQTHTKPVKRMHHLWRSPIHLVISAVDNRNARADLHQLCTQEGAQVYYLLDCGNHKNTGQVILGQPNNQVNRQPTGRLPTSMELYPEVINRRRKDRNLPSCSALESLMHQDLFINEAIATTAANLLWRLLRYGELDHHGMWLNLECGMYTPMPVPLAPSQGL